MANIVFPTPAELKEIEKDKLAVLTADDPAFKIVPVVTEDVVDLQWEQEDNYTGLQNVRGLNGQPGRVTRVGAKRYKCEVGYYGDFEEIDEKEITERRKLGTFDESINIDDIVIRRQELLLQREIDRQRKIIWDLLTTGTFTSTNSSGNLVHTDSFPIQTATGSNWSTLSSATPLLDIRAIKPLARGRSVRFDASATMHMNLTTLNYMLNNSNSADLGGKRVEMGATFNTLVDINKVMAAHDLPKIEVYDETWFTEGTTSVNLFIPNRTVVVIGKRTNNAAIADLAQVRNAQNPNSEPGPYTLVTDSLSSSMNPVPRKVRVDRGWNGGVRLYFPSAIVALTV